MAHDRAEAVGVPGNPVRLVPAERAAESRGFTGVDVVARLGDRPRHLRQLCRCTKRNDGPDREMRTGCGGVVHDDRRARRSPLVSLPELLVGRATRGAELGPHEGDASTVVTHRQHLEVDPVLVEERCHLAARDIDRHQDKATSPLLLPRSAAISVRPSGVSRCPAVSAVRPG